MPLLCGVLLNSAGMSGRSAYDGLVEPKPAWSAYREVAYGYTMFEATHTSINYKFFYQK